MGRQLVSALLWSALIGALAGSLMCIIAFSENLSMQVVDADGHLDAGFLAQLFLTWSAPVAAAAFGLIVIGILVVGAVRWAATRATSPRA
jgi:hypothetical protein